jgi:hypothetical protein
MTFGLASSEFRQKNNKLEKNCKLEKNWTQKWLIYWSEKVEKVEKKSWTSVKVGWKRRTLPEFVIRNERQQRRFI